MKLYLFFYKTPLFVAVEKNNLKIIELLLKRQDIDVNQKSIENLIFQYHFTLNI